MYWFTTSSLKTDSQNTKLRWYQFTLVHILVFVLLASVVLSWFSTAYHKARKERAAAKELQEQGAALDTWIGWQEVVLGDDYAPVVQADLRNVEDIHAAIGCLEALTHIEDLNLAGTSVVDNDIKHFKHLTSLTSLDLSNTRVTDVGLDCLQGLKNLHWLTLDHSQITDLGIKKLRKQLPNVEVQMVAAVGTDKK